VDEDQATFVDRQALIRSTVEVLNFTPNFTMIGQRVCRWWKSGSVMVVGHSHDSYKLMALVPRSAAVGIGAKSASD
jgi:hypothetical protein